MAKKTAAQQRQAILEAIHKSDATVDTRLGGIDKRLIELGDAVKGNTAKLGLYGESIAVLNAHRGAQSARTDQQDGRIDKLEDRERSTAINVAAGGVAGIFGGGLWQFLSQLFGK